jgi:Cu/Zn superoxide dismutase
LTFELLAPDVTLRSGPTSVFDTDGSAIVIHQTVDDCTSDPAGMPGIAWRAV